MNTTRRRSAQRRSAAQKRLARQAARNAGQMVCQVGFCGGTLLTDIDALGRTVVRCPQCERRRAGICRDCPRPVAGTVGRALRCAACADRRRRAQIRQSVARHAEEIRAKNRQRFREQNADPRARARLLEYKRLWRKANPDKVRAQKQRYVERHGANGASAYIRYHRRYNATPAARAKRHAATAAAAAERPAPRCRQCGREIPWARRRGGHRPMRCIFHRDRYAVRANVKRWVARDEADDMAAAPARRIASRPRLKVQRPQPARYATTGQRLCTTPGCDIVLTGRKKKCRQCRARDHEVARRALAARAGRGRRTDLARRAS